MPFALVTVGLLFIVIGFQDTYKEFGEQVQKDFTGDGNFIYWVISLGILGSFGYIKELRTFSRLTMGLVILVLFLSNKGFFDQFNSAVQSGTTQPVNPIGTPIQGSPSGSSSTSSDSSGMLGSLGAASSFASFFQ